MAIEVLWFRINKSLEPKVFYRCVIVYSRWWENSVLCECTDCGYRKMIVLLFFLSKIMIILLVTRKIINLKWPFIAWVMPPYYLNFNPQLSLLCLTLNAFELASTATETGPTFATAAWRFDSLPLWIATVPDIEAPTLFLLKLQDDCCG